MYSYEKEGTVVVGAVDVVVFCAGGLAVVTVVVVVAVDMVGIGAGFCVVVVGF